MKTLYIEIKNVYGRPTYYPACNLSAQLAAFKGQKTFTAQDIKALKEMGFNFSQAVSVEAI